MPLPVWDSHTHLQGAALPAASFWDIGHYFWYLQQLVAAGYPADHRSLGEDERCAAYARAYAATRNTTMHWTVARILDDLYGVRITDAASVRAADAAIRAAGAGPDWAQRVCERGALRRIVVNEPEDATFAGVPDTACLVPRVETQIRDWIARLAAGDDAAGVRAAIATALAAYAAAGCGGVMTSLEAFGPSAGLRRLRTLRSARDEHEPPGADPDARAAFVCHALCAGRRGARPLPSAPGRNRARVRPRRAAPAAGARPSTTRSACSPCTASSATTAASSSWCWARASTTWTPPGR